MKYSDAQTLAAVMRAHEVNPGRRGAPVPDGVFAPAHTDWLDALHSSAEAPQPRGSELDARPEPVRGSGGGSAQLLAAAHAVAAYWLHAGQAALLTRAAETFGGGGQAVTIRVNYLTPEGGLAAVELAHPDLGALGIEISLSGCTLSVLATVETEHAGLAIREGRAALAMKLREQGITLQTLEVVVLRRRGGAPQSKSKRQES